MPPPKLPDLTKCQLPRLTALYAECKTWAERVVKSNDQQAAHLADLDLANSFEEDEVRRRIEVSSEALDNLASTGDYLLRAYSKEEQTEGIIAASKDTKASVDKYYANIEKSVLGLRRAWSELQARDAENGPAAAVAGGGAAAAAPAARPQSVAALEPPILTHTDPPKILFGWAQKFKIWRKSSNFHLYDRETDLALFCGRLDDTLIERIAPLIGATMPVVTDVDGDPSCLNVLINEFLKLYPIFNRRLDYSRFMSSGQSFTEFYSELRQLKKAAEVEAMSDEDHFVFKILTCFKDDGMTNKFIELEDPSLKNIVELGQRLESTRLAKAKLKETPAKAAQARSGGGGGRSSGGGRGSGGGGGGGGGSQGKGGAKGGSSGSGNSSGNSKDDKKDGKEEKTIFKCRFCNWSFKKKPKLDKHESKCPAREGKCDGCGKKGVYKPACPTCKGSTSKTGKTGK